MKNGVLWCCFCFYLIEVSLVCFVIWWMGVIVLDFFFCVIVYFVDGYVEVQCFVGYWVVEVYVYCGYVDFVYGYYVLVVLFE